MKLANEIKYKFSRKTSFYFIELLILIYDVRKSVNTKNSKCS
jgi:hypothetical protein